jgi:hypothetical protein
MSSFLQQIELALPSVLTLDPSGQPTRQERGTIRVLPSGKPPKLRFRPGSFIRYQGKLYEVMFAYRVAAEPSEWLYCCEERQGLKSGELSTFISGLTEALGAGETTPRVVMAIFHDSMQARQFFVDIPVGRDRITFKNKQLVQNAQLVSSGEVLGPAPRVTP